LFKTVLVEGLTEWDISAGSGGVFTDRRRLESSFAAEDGGGRPRESRSALTVSMPMRSMMTFVMELSETEIMRAATSRGVRSGVKEGERRMPRRRRIFRWRK